MSLGWWVPFSFLENPSIWSPTMMTHHPTAWYLLLAGGLLFIDQLEHALLADEMKAITLPAISWWLTAKLVALDIGV